MSVPCKTVIVICSVALVAALAVYGVNNSSTIRWRIWSNSYKAKALAQTASVSGNFKHIEWDGWGWAGQDTSVYLVFDPTDSLSAAAQSHKPGTFSGIPCEVFLVRRLENQWYTVQFYTNEFWGRRNALNCTESRD
jgi:hypothetical protein